jgi:hypothetical protein
MMSAGNGRQASIDVVMAACVWTRNAAWLERTAFHGYCTSALFLIESRFATIATIGYASTQPISFSARRQTMCGTWWRNNEDQIDTVNGMAELN